jgi:hypothetical protein
MPRALTSTAAVLEAIVDCLVAVDRRQLQYAVVRDIEPDPSRWRKQALVFVKPELLRAGQDRLGILQTVNAKLVGCGLSTGGAAVLGPGRMAAIVAEHYGVINRVSRLGLQGLTRLGLDELHQHFAAELAAGTPVFGGHQLAVLPEVLIDDLSEAWRGTRSIKLAPGAYAGVIHAAGRRVVALNGFHPEQLARYSTDDARVVAFEVSWNSLPWREFRSLVIGATDPQEADSRSIRGYVRDNRGMLGVGEVNRGHNGVHGSAGPLEAMVELSRFFAVPQAATCFGALIRASLDDAARTGLAPVTAEQKPIGVDLHEFFEATEECEPADALRIIGHRARPKGSTPV